VEDALQSTDVAIIGLACRFPRADNPGDLWRLLRDGREVTALDKLAEVADFDANFFNISPREACAMDPRQRLALELAWEVIEDAGIVPETCSGEQVSVFLGAMNDDYAFLTLDASLDHHSFAGVSRAMIANRISYAFGLQGASMTVDSGQSSSLVAVHLACENLRTGESQLAIAGGVHLNLADETALLESEFGALSPTGRTYAFDDRADGYVRSEGGGLVLLKPLGAALDDGDRIRGIIRSSAVGNAGQNAGHGAAGLTVPSAAGQADVIRRALAAAGLDSTHVQYVEAHGTGTEIGDPVEAAALGEIFAHRQQRPVSVGSIKTNIGHTGGAAGIAGLLKALLAIEKAAIPASLNFASPAINLESLGLQVDTALTPWPASDGPRRAGVSSFGMGGTNAHLILEQPPPAAVTRPHEGDATIGLVTSGRSPRALAGQAARLLAYLEGRDTDPVDVGWSLATTRSTFEHRAVVIGTRPEDLMKGLAALAAGAPAANVVAGRVQPLGKTVFVFPGQGSQWLGMGRQLHERFPVFERAFDEAAQALDGHLRLPLREVMWGNDAPLLESTEFAQPALFAVEVALAALLRSCGVTPGLVLGHSLGEISAAHVAGVLSLADAAVVVAARGRLMAALPAGGVMIAVAASEDEVAPLLDDGVSIAAVNGPDSVVISGAAASVTLVADRLAQQGRRVRQLAVSHAFHSVLMEPMLDQFAQALTGVDAAQPRIGLVSNMTGQPAGPGYGSAQYWTEHVRRPVRFVDGVRAVEALGAGMFVEVGPGGALATAVEESLVATARGEAAPAVVAIAKDRPEAESLITALARLFVAGVGVDWGAVFDGLGARRVGLPTYAFDRRRYWVGDAVEVSTEQPTPNLSEWLRGLAPKERHRQLVELLCAHAAVVLGHSSGGDIDADRAFQDLGFGSMAGVELRNRLKADTGLALPRTLIFDYPTPAALADYLNEQLSSDRHHKQSDDERIRSLLLRIPIQELRRTGLLERLLLLAGDTEKPTLTPVVSADIIDSLSPEALIAMALNSADDDDAK
jgi:acyl transferase domain-containing protein